MFDDLQTHLSVHKNLLEGSWVNLRSGYEDDICCLLEMKREESRYYDASWKAYCLEFKKGKSIWLDLVRYSEIVLKLSPESSKETVTLFFPHSNDWKRIDSIIGVETKRIIEMMALDVDVAKKVLELKKSVPRQLNALASLTMKDVRKIAQFVI